MACGRLAILRFEFEPAVKLCILTQCVGGRRITESVVPGLNPVISAAYWTRCEEIREGKTSVASR